MMKNKIVIKLVKNFAASLLIFSIIIGSIFFYFFRNYTVKVHKNELLKYANSLLSVISSEESPDHIRRKDGYGSYLRFVVNVTNIDVWIVDENMELTTFGMGLGEMHGKHNLPPLPLNAEELISKVFQGETAFSKGFSETLAQTTLTLGAPMKNNFGEVIGALILHSPVEDTNLVIRTSLYILFFSMILALLITSVVSVFLSYYFTKPLNKMKDVALQLSEGEYTAKCNVLQNDEIGELANTIDLLSYRLQEASKESGKLERLRRDFIANISHELRTPITVIRGSLEVLSDRVVTDADKVDEYHVQMLSEVRFLERLVNDLLDLSKLQNMDFIINKKKINLNDVMNDALRSIAPIANKKRLVVETQSVEEIINIQGDYGRLRQMILILIDNAVKFSPDNSKIEISISKEKITIMDYGLGIDEEHLPFIFNRFYKTVGEENKSGTGLGLAIAKQIAECHDIKLDVENNPAGGTKFICYLP